MKVEKKISFTGISNINRNNSVGIINKSTELEKDKLKKSEETTGGTSAESNVTETNEETNVKTKEDEQGGIEVLKKNIFEVRI